MRIERTAKTVIAGLMSVACLASVAACGPGSSSNKANTETEAVSTDLGDTKYELKLWDGAGLKTFDDQLIEAFQKKYPNITVLLQCLFDRFGSVFPQCGLMVFPGVVIVSR